MNGQRPFRDTLPASYLRAVTVFAILVPIVFFRMEGSLKEKRANLALCLAIGISGGAAMWVLIGVAAVRALS